MPRFLGYMLVMAIGWASCNGTLQAQDVEDSGNVEQPSREEDEAVSKDTQWALEQIHRLDHSSYRTRQVARALLEENPHPTLQVIPDVINQVDTVIGIQLVEILSGLALHTDLQVSSLATGTLNSLTAEATSIGRMATNSLSALADLQEQKAYEILTNQGAYIGPQNFSINGRLDRTSDALALRIDDQFWGSPEDFEWIRYLKSVKIVYLRGDKIGPQALEAVSQLKNVKAIRLRSIQLTKEQLLLFQELDALEHLGLSYMQVDDSFIPNLLQLPISQSIRLYGTQVSLQGEMELVKHFDGLEVFRGSGGFLGVTSISRQPRVEVVTPDSAAGRAGILQNDLILAINDVPIDTFDQLRNELGKYTVGETVRLRLERNISSRLETDPQTIELTVMATLQEENH